MNYKELIVRFLDKQTNDEENIKLKEWVLESKERRKIFDSYNEVWHMANAQSNNTFAVDEKWLELKHSIFESGSGKEMSLIRKGKLLIWKVAAAVILIVTILGGLLYTKSIKPLYSEDVQINVPKGHKTRIILADGTTVWLNSDTEFRYNETYFMKNRQVMLEGEAYFNVVADENNPFIVKTSSVDIKVYGTQFNVHAYPGKRYISATLEEGKIGIEFDVSEKQVFLSPGQQIKVNKKTGKSSVEEVQPDLYSIWKENQLKFKNSTFSEMIDKLEVWYNVEIILDKQLLKSEDSFTFSIQNENLPQILEHLKKTSKIDYTVNEDQVEIFSTIKN